MLQSAIQYRHRTTVTSHHRTFNAPSCYDFDGEAQRAQLNANRVVWLSSCDDQCADKPLFERWWWCRRSFYSCTVSTQKEQLLSPQTNIKNQKKSRLKILSLQKTMSAFLLSILSQSGRIDAMSLLPKIITSQVTPTLPWEMYQAMAIACSWPWH